MMPWLKRNAAVLTILVASVAAHFAWFGSPARVVFDEVHFGKFSSAYVSQQHYFDNHPPTGKLLIGAMAKLSGYHESFPFKSINDKYTGSWYIWFRLLPAIVGTFIPLLVWAISRKLGAAPIAAWAAGMFMVLENGYIVQTRFILLDGFLVFFGLAGVLSWLVARERGTWRWHLLAAALLGLAGTVKWTGFGFLGAIGLAQVVLLAAKRERFRKWFALGATYVMVPILLYFLSFAVHFAVLTKPGIGDGFFKPGFLSRSVISKTWETNYQMAATQKQMGRHPYESPWYTWPLMLRPIYYWAGDQTGDVQPKVYYLGNPAVFAVALAGIVSLFLYVYYRWSDASRRGAYLLVLLLYAANFLPFMLITRAMFLYHYMSALAVGIIAASLALSWLPERRRGLVCAALVLVAAASFVYFAPLTYGLPMSGKAFEYRMWLKTWR